MPTSSQVSAAALTTVSAMTSSPSDDVLPPVNGAWDAHRAADHLDATVIPVRLSFLDPDGHPRVLSLWFVHQAGHLWCATRPSAVVARAVERDARVGVEVAADRPPYCGVRGRGRAVVHPEKGAEVLRLLIGRYLEPDDVLIPKLLAGADDEVAIEIIPESWHSWDFSSRMGADHR